MRSLVILLAMMRSGRAMRVCGEIVELGCSLMGIVWHGVSFRTIDPSRATPWRVLGRHSNGTWRQGQLPGGQTAKVHPDYRVQSLHKGHGRHAFHRIRTTHYSDCQDGLLSGCGHVCIGSDNGPTAPSRSSAAPRYLGNFRASVLHRCTIVSDLNSNHCCNAGTPRNVFELTSPGSVVQKTVTLFVRPSMHMSWCVSLAVSGAFFFSHRTSLSADSFISTNPP
jgi:hypothetical protein